MALSSNKPIVVAFSGLDGDEYKNYTVAMTNSQGSLITLYTGRTYVNLQGRTSVRVDGVLRDFVARRHSTFNSDTQKLEPAELRSLSALLPKVEADGNVFFATTIVVQCGGQSKAIEVYGGYTLPWIGAEMGALDTMNLATLDSSILPHIPPLSNTTNMWLGLTLYVKSSDVLKLGIGSETPVTLLMRSDTGTLQVAFNLANMLEELSGMASDIDGGTPGSGGDDIDGGTPSTEGDDIDGGTPDDSGSGSITPIGGNLKLYINDVPTVVAIADTCPADYYVAWELPGGGWFCWPFNGNALYDNETDVSAIRTMTDEETVMDITQRTHYTLYSELASREVWNILCTMQLAREVYVYDTKRDRGAFCTATGNNIATAGRKMWRAKPFTFTATEKTYKTL